MFPTLQIFYRNIKKDIEFIIFFFHKQYTVFYLTFHRYLFVFNLLLYICKKEEKKNILQHQTVQ